MFEFTENERISDTRHVERIIKEYKRLGFTTAIDDFGAGYAGLNLLANFQPDVVKVDMEIIRGIANSPSRQAILTGIMAMAQALGTTVIAEGVESQTELEMLQAAGVELFQGFLFARPALEALPQVMFLRQSQSGAERTSSDEKSMLVSVRHASLNTSL